MLDLRGNTAVYMLYAHARIASIIRKAGKDVAQLAASAAISLDHPCEVRSPLLPLLVLQGQGQDTDAAPRQVARSLATLRYPFP